MKNLKEKMYVRCPWDPEHRTEPRNFVCGQVMETDEFKKTVKVKVWDPFRYAGFYEDVRTGILEFPEGKAVRCRLFTGSDVLVDGIRCTVLSNAEDEDEYRAYYVQNRGTKAVFKVSEQDIVASFTDGRVDPLVQLKRYEFQNPCWYFGRSIVSSNINILDNAMYGFRTLAGSKIYLLSHQVNTIMRCLQETPCRYMLADEVGMGKTIEALSVLKIYLEDRTGQRVLILVPQPLRKQWKTEMLLKFDIPEGRGKNGNVVSVMAIEELGPEEEEEYDFLIADEIHRYLGNPDAYESLLALSRRTGNVLLLSATPVQSRDEEYLKLLQLLQPAKYDSYSPEYFRGMLEKQNSMIQKTSLVLDDLEELEEARKNASEEGTDPHESEDCRDLWEEIYDDLGVLCDRLEDGRLSELYGKIDFRDEDLGIYNIKVFISYICCGYQVESNIIRNRRRILEAEEDGTRLLPRRECIRIPYPLDPDKNQAETVCWRSLTDWVEENAGGADADAVLRPLLGSFFSSSWAFDACLKHLKKEGCEFSPVLMESAAVWKRRESYLLSKMERILSDPEAMETRYSSRMIAVLNCVCEELYDKTVVLFTGYAETFEAYKKALTDLLPEGEASFFCEGMEREDLELSVFRFQNDPACRIMLCDNTGGEGHNFQRADYVVHIDLPWEADRIEQRIGRLDRLERDPERNVVTSVVVYAEDTFEESLFRFWNEGLKIFTQSLSGMEIIMKDIDREIMDAVREDFRYGLPDKIPEIIQSAEKMRQTVLKEQNYDVAGYLFRPMNLALGRLVEYYRKNENALFADSMLNWASLAGFFGTADEKGVITFSERSFSGKAAMNSRFLPPVWADYMNEGQIQFVNAVWDAREKKPAGQKLSYRNTDRSIRGTFLRKVAIGNDYLHFFAPGDAIYDSIVHNAIRSCKGTATAFAVSFSHEWKGFLFTFSMAPDLSKLLDRGLTLHALSPYRSYLATDQISIAVAIENTDEVPDEEILRQVRRATAEWKDGKGYVHLGKRSKERKFLGDRISGTSNIAWFKQNYPRERWQGLLKEAGREAVEKAKAVFRTRTKLSEAREEMERIRSAKTAAGLFYGTEDETVGKLKKEQAVILDAMKSSKLCMDSAAFVWMVKDTDGHFQA